jgi:hypothetical protein
MKRNGFYIKKEKKGELILNIYVDDFKAYLDELTAVNGWVRFSIYEREKPALNGLTHNMQAIQVILSENK